MRPLFSYVIFLALALSNSAIGSGNFSFEGFALGMSRQEASDLRPESTWYIEMPNTRKERTRKTFMSKHLGQEARVVVTLDNKAEFVRIIAFTFSGNSKTDCISDATSVLLHLRKVYGAGSESKFPEQFPVRQIKWVASNDSMVEWSEACAAGQYVLAYTKNES
jgi:hypothetical protein